MVLVVDRRHLWRGHHHPQCRPHLQRGHHHPQCRPCPLMGHHPQHRPHLQCRLMVQILDSHLHLISQPLSQMMVMMTMICTSMNCPLVEAHLRPAGRPLPRTPIKPHPPSLILLKPHLLLKLHPFSHRLSTTNSWTALTIFLVMIRGKTMKTTLM